MSKEKSPAYQHYPKDIQADVNYRCLPQRDGSRGAYRDLLDFIWMEESLPNDDEKLASLVNLSLEEWQHIKDPILRLFTQEKSGSFRHKRLDAERKKQHNYRKAQSESGKKGAKKRWGNPKGSNELNGDPINSPMAKNSSPHYSFQSAGSILQNNTPPLPPGIVEKSEDQKPEGGDEKGIRSKLDAETLRDEQLDALSKIPGAPPNLDQRAGGLFYRIGLEIPKHIIRKSLRATLDAQHRFQNFNPSRYYTATLRNLCRIDNIPTTINFSQKAPVIPLKDRSQGP